MTTDQEFVEKLDDGWASDEEQDAHKHDTMLDAITSLHGQTKIQRQRTEPSKASEFYSAGDGKVKVHDLVKALPKSVIQDKLRKQLRSAEKQKKHVQAPLHRHQQEQIERGVAYDKSKKEMDRWEPLVTDNKQADQLSFPLQRETVTFVDTDAFVARFQPSTSLELEVAKLLRNSEHVIQPDKMLTEAEERALLAMDIGEAKLRRQELQRHRALMSYKTAKLKRQSKIKSRSYRRIVKKERSKQELRAFDELRDADPEAFLQRLDEMDNARITERMNLKHKVKSRRLRKQAKFSKYDDNMREAMQEMVRKNKELTQKVSVDPESDDDVTDVALQDDVANLSANRNTTGVKNPWMSAAIKTKPPKLSKPVKLVNEEAMKASEHCDDVTEEAEHQQLVTNSENMHQETQSKLHTTEMNTSASENVQEIDAIFSQPTVQTKPKENKRKKKKNRKKSDKTNVTTNSNLKTDIKPEMVKSSAEAEVMSDDDGDDEELLLSTTRRQTLEDFEGDWAEQEAANQMEVPHSNLQVAKSHPTAACSKSARAETAAAQINPDAYMSVQTSVAPSGGLMLVDEEDAEDQRITIAQAFAADDIVAEFVEEKRAQEKKEAPGDVDLTLPGWGDWGGQGAPMPRRKKKKFVLRAPKIKRKDEGRSDVIIRQAKDNKAVKHQLSSLPRGYTNAETYEAYIRQPLGKTWNPETVFRKLTKPKMTTQLGAIIEPISTDELTKYEEKQKNMPTKRKASDSGNAEPAAKRKFKGQRRNMQRKKKVTNTDNSVIKI